MSPKITTPPALGGPFQICRWTVLKVDVVVEPVWYPYKTISLTIQPGAPSAQCIIDRLPAGGRPKTLPNFGDQVLDNDSCQTDPPLPLHSDRFQNVLLGQTIALALNLRLDPNLGSLVLCTQMTTDNGVFPIDASVIEAMVTIGGGHTASSLLALANRALAGGDTLGVSPKLINTAVDAVNRAFDECATLTGCD